MAVGQSAHGVDEVCWMACKVKREEKSSEKTKSLWL